MAVAALIISILALLASGASAWYARRQAHAATVATAIERSRLYTERRPSFRADIKEANRDNDYYQLWVTMTSAEQMDALEVELPTPCSFEFVTSSPAVTDKTHAISWEVPITENGGGLWLIRPTEGTRREVEYITVTARHDSDQWERTVEVDVPYDVLDSIG